MSVPRTVRLRARALAKTEGIRYTAALRRVEEDWAREHSATKSEYRNEECDETDETCSNCGCLGGLYREDWGTILCPECFARFKEARHALGLLDVPATKERVDKVSAPVPPGKETCPGQFTWSAFGATYPDTVCASVLDWDEAGYHPGPVLCDADDDHRPKDVPCPFCDSEGFVRWTWGEPDEYSLVWESDRSAVKRGTEVHFHEDTEKRSLWWTATHPTRGEEPVRFIARVEKAFRENISVVLPCGFEPARHEARLLQKMSDAGGSGWHVDHYESDREVVLTRTVTAYVEDDGWDAEAAEEVLASRPFVVGERVAVSPEAAVEVSYCENIDMLAGKTGYVAEVNEDDGEVFVVPEPGDWDGSYIPVHLVSHTGEGGDAPAETAECPRVTEKQVSSLAEPAEEVLASRPFVVGERVAVSPEAAVEVSYCENIDMLAGKTGYVAEVNEDDGEVFVVPEPGDWDGSYIPVHLVSHTGEGGDAPAETAECPRVTEKQVSSLAEAPRDEVGPVFKDLVSDRIRDYDGPGADGEEFCSRCFAGVDSSEHHSKCVQTGWAEDGESAPEAAPTWAERPGPHSDGDCQGTRCDDCGCCMHSASCSAAMDGGCRNPGCGCTAVV